MKILILANNDVGLFKFRKELIRQLIEDHHTVYVSLPNGIFVPELEAMGCFFTETIIDRRGINPFKDLRLLISYCKMMKKIKPDLILTYTIKPNIYGGLASRLLKIPYISNITGLGSGMDRKYIKNIILFLYRLSSNKADCLFFQNEENMQKLKTFRISGKKSFLIPGSGVNTTEYSYENYPEDGIIKFLFIGRIIKDKGIEEYISAAELLKGKAEFHVIGVIDDEHYNNIITHHNKDNTIIYHGSQKDVKPFIRESHCVVLPSYHEGMSNVLLEAASMGRALITTNVCGCREIVDNGVNGYLCNVRDANDLYRKINQFIGLNRTEMIEMGIKGRKKIAKVFDRSIIVEEYCKEIREIERRMKQ